MTTIKQLAEELGVSKQTIFNQIDKLGLRQNLTIKGRSFDVPENVINEIKASFNQFDRQVFDVSQPSKVDDDLIVKLTMENEKLKLELKLKGESLEKQIEILDREIEKRQKENEGLLKLLDQEQQLHMATKKEMKLLEEPKKRRRWFWEKKDD